MTGHPRARQLCILYLRRPFDRARAVLGRLRPDLSAPARPYLRPARLDRAARLSHRRRHVRLGREGGVRPGRKHFLQDAAASSPCASLSLLLLLLLHCQRSHSTILSCSTRSRARTSRSRPSRRSSSSGTPARCFSTPDSTPSRTRRQLTTSASVAVWTSGTLGGTSALTRRAARTRSDGEPGFRASRGPGSATPSCFEMCVDLLLLLSSYRDGGLTY